MYKRYDNHNMKYLKDEMWGEQKKGFKKIQESIFGTIDCFQHSVNVIPYKYSEGTVIQAESKIIDDLIGDTKSFLKSLEERKQNITVRRSNERRQRKIPLIVCMSFDRCPEVISNEVMSYLPSIQRFKNLRSKYNDKYLTDGLSKKNVKQLRFIFLKYVGVIKEFSIHFLNLPEIYGPMYGRYDYIDRDYSADFIYDEAMDHFCHCYDRDSDTDTKAEKIKRILKLFIWFVEKPLYKNIIKRTDYQDLCNRAIKILHILVIAIYP